MNIINILIVALETGLIFSLMAMGVNLTYKILDIADLTVEGSFPLGAFVVALALQRGLNPILGLGLSFILGGMAGYISYILYQKLKIQSLLSGILTMTMLYSVNLRILGKSNINLFEYDGIFSYLGDVDKWVLLLVIVVIFKIGLDMFFKTEKGYLLLATGDNENLVKQLGINPSNFIALGLILANGLVGLSGALMAQYQGFADVSMGASMIVTALASIIIGDSFLKKSSKLKMTTRAIIGAIIYRTIIALVMYKGLQPGDMRGITAIIVIIFIVYNNLQEKLLGKLRR